MAVAGPLVQGRELGRPGAAASVVLTLHGTFLIRPRMAPTAFWSAIVASCEPQTRIFRTALAASWSVFWRAISSAAFAPVRQILRRCLPASFPRGRIGQDGIDRASDFELLLPKALHAASLRASMFCFATVKVRARGLTGVLSARSTLQPIL